MLFSAAKKVLVNGAKTSKICSKLSPLAFRPMVTLTEKEMGEETKYIRQKEREAMKAKIEKILDSEDSSEEKQQLGKLLGEIFKLFLYLYIYIFKCYIKLIIWFNS